jgi:hypothetical protein
LLSLQVVLRAREAISSYYDGWLVADDEVACSANQSKQWWQVALWGWGSQL